MLSSLVRCRSRWLCGSGLLLSIVLGSAAWAGPPGEPAKGQRPGDRRSLLQRLRPFKQTSVIVTAGLSLGPIVGVSSSVGLVLRPRGSALPQGPFLQNGLDLALVGGRHIASPVAELRGREWNLGPRNVDHPIYGDRVGLPLIPEVLGISAARSGGLGVSFALPIPGLPYTMFRVPCSIYVANPRLCRVSSKVNDGIDRLTVAAARLGAPVRRSATRLARLVPPPVARAAARGVRRIKTPGARPAR